MHIAVTGSSGLIGSALVRSLRGDSHEVVRLVRRVPDAPDEAEWDPKRSYVDTAAIEGCDAVVHLAGAGVGDRRWTARYKQEIRESRVLGTTTIAEALAGLDRPPRVFVSGSAVGYYGDTGDRVVDESAPPGAGFLARVCQDWEGATAAARDAGVRTVMARTGLVVASGGGAWGRLFPLFKAGLGGRLGSGRQYWSFIALHDHIAALRHLIDTEGLSGPVNLTAPEPVTNAEATAAMGRVLHRPTVATVPAPVLRIALGDFAQEILTGQRAVPRRLLDSGFAFAFPRIDDAIRAAADDRS
ncbi:TIGR01777 family oxidoreductase [Streptomyces sp. RB6PN25]|uniref:TIGR01777 family oxidoreductase n=1 Tax=Streptomyces humicola TaxID=2953240 RepID=A0ABT1PVC1_9ACTN|nr:TIGR01777 family oxidoreductase [Streptomyces humicola]MCQ4081616.1 TIGR01777 family oxidoreductase [Streptomyces humicola]